MPNEPWPQPPSEIDEPKVIGEVLSIERDLNHTIIEAGEDETYCFSISKNRFFEIITNNQKIAQNIIHMVSGGVLEEG